MIIADLIPLLDLTRLVEPDQAETIRALCAEAQTDDGSVAAVCVYPQWVSLAKKQLKATSIKVATVINFPSGDESLDHCRTMTQQALADGADEIDIVCSYHRLLRGDDSAFACVEQCRALCSSVVLLKVILETGALLEAGLIAKATHMAINAGADFIKTSTGKIAVGATLEAAAIILETIRQQSQRLVGLKLSGGIQTVDQALAYCALVENTMGAAWITPRTLRFGTSRLLASIKTLINQS